LLPGVRHQNTGETAVKWQIREKKWNLLGVPISTSLIKQNKNFLENTFSLALRSRQR